MRSRGLRIGQLVHDCRDPRRNGTLANKDEHGVFYVRGENGERYQGAGRYWRLGLKPKVSAKQPGVETVNGWKRHFFRPTPYSEIPVDRIDEVTKLAAANGVSVSFAWAALNE